jgi:hypothetical protein
MVRRNGGGRSTEHGGGAVAGYAHDLEGLCGAVRDRGFQPALANHLQSGSGPVPFPRVLDSSGERDAGANPGDAGQDVARRLRLLLPKALREEPRGPTGSQARP